MFHSFDPKSVGSAPLELDKVCLPFRPKIDPILLSHSYPFRIYLVVMFGAALPCSARPPSPLARIAELDQHTYECRRLAVPISFVFQKTFSSLSCHCDSQ